MTKDKLKQIQNMVAERPQDPFVRYALAMEYLKQKMNKEAVETFTNIVSEFPNYTGVYYHLTKFYIENGEGALAKATYFRGLEACRISQANHDLMELKTLGEDYFEDHD